ncbi:MAG: hypothetical protein IT382_04595 [Deltaproteobacteria bacterium]|nr:hypothetical protein [Deltaproteobacteria bacterium]
MPVALTPTNSLTANRQTDAQRSETASVNHVVEAGAVVEVGSSGNSQVTAEVTGASGNTSIHCANPATVLARLRAGNIATSASDTRAFTVRADAQLNLAIDARVHAEVFARVDGGELENAGTSTITTPCNPSGGSGTPVIPTHVPQASTASQDASAPMQDAPRPRRRRAAVAAAANA